MQVGISSIESYRCRLEGAAMLLLKRVNWVSGPSAPLVRPIGLDVDSPALRNAGIVPVMTKRTRTARLRTPYELWLEYPAVDEAEVESPLDWWIDRAQNPQAYLLKSSFRLLSTFSSCPP